jgi:hypothetical protein
MTTVLERRASWLSRVRLSASASPSIRTSSLSHLLERNKGCSVRDIMLVRLFDYASAFMIDDPSIEELRKENRNLTLMVQADMIAYHDPEEPPQLGLPAMYVSSGMQLES